MLVNQGDIYWVVPDEAEYAHPHVVVQENAINHSQVNTVVVCALTTNLKRVSQPGNILLELAEANLPKQSLVVASQVSTINKSQLGEYIGTLSKERVDQILAGMRFLQKIGGHSETR